MTSPVEYYILCVDDDEEFLRSLEFFLPDQINDESQNEMWCRFIFLADPSEALNVLGELKADGETLALILSDQKMPGMTGTVLLDRARQAFADCVRVLLTGHAGIESAVLAINGGTIDAYLTKPIESEESFTRCVRELVAEFHAHHLRAQSGTTNVVRAIGTGAPWPVELDSEAQLVDLSDVIRTTVEQTRTVSSRPITFQCDLADGEAWAHVRGSDIRRVIETFLDNAIKFSKADKPIEVTLSEQDGWLVASSRDEGIGFPRELSGELRRPRTLPDFDGSGGTLHSLTRANELAHVAGGRIEAWSDGIGRGATFALYVPAARRQAA
ncbi:MAG: response regulator [Candidatus Eisenbacteria bacterium]|uniref:Response regulator n=1 Tax=Eiseniibacteriota bacterium TaxID=2212470 RepID=A0A956SG97_UNCEI|nr:response regulator [Candidatus Eisenbacteria bacterium]